MMVCNDPDDPDASPDCLPCDAPPPRPVRRHARPTILRESDPERFTARVKPPPGRADAGGMDGGATSLALLAPLAVGIWGVLTVLNITAICVRDERMVHDLKRRVMTMRNERIQKVIDAGGVVLPRAEDQIVNV